MKICLYNIKQDKDSISSEEGENNLYLVDGNFNKKIPLIKNYPSIELCCIDSLFKSKICDEDVNFKISCAYFNKNFHQLICINSFRKRRLINKKINFDTDPQNFIINVKAIPEVIGLFNFFKKTNLINCDQYFFGFLINFYFYAIEKK